MKTYIRILLICSVFASLFFANPTPVVQAGGIFSVFQLQGDAFRTEFNGLSYRVDSSGLQTEGYGINWHIGFTGMGRGNRMEDVSRTDVVQTEEQVEYRRSNVTEWYRATPLGLQQGFTIFQSPRGNGNLVLRLAVETDMNASVDENGLGISFSKPDGSNLRYDGLRVFDVNGVDLPARMIYTPAQVVIQVDDAAAVYPVTVDPIIHYQWKMTAPIRSVDQTYGNSIDVDGSTLVVGAYGEGSSKGAAYVYVRQTSGGWGLQQKLTDLSGVAGDEFGYSVAVSGNTIIVGAPGDQSNTGSAFIFIRSGTTWTLQQKLFSSIPTGADQFGFDVAISGDSAIVGMPFADVNGNSDRGAVGLFQRSGTVWTQNLFSSNGAGGGSGDNFGYSVDIDGIYAVAGAPSDDEFFTDQGSVIVFTLLNNNWVLSQGLLSTSGAGIGDKFGYDVSLDNGRLAVGVPGDDVSVTDQGSVFLFKFNGATFAPETQLVATSPVVDETFGLSVSTSNGMVLVGAPNANSAQGKVIIFTNLISGSWVAQNTLIASDGVSGDYFGNTVAIDGTNFFAGVPFDDTAQGSIYFYEPYRTDADLAVSITSAASGPLTPGDQVILTLTLVNYGPATASFPVTVYAGLPAGLDFDSASATAGSYNSSTGAWNLTSLAVGFGHTLTLIATVPAIPAQILKVNTYLLAQDAIRSNNSASVNLQVVAAQAQFSAQLVDFGLIKTFTTSDTPRKLSVKNTGQGTLRISTVTLTDPATRFSIASDGCTGKSIQAGASCVISFNTGGYTSTGSATAFFNIASNLLAPLPDVQLKSRGANEIAINGGFNNFTGNIPNGWTPQNFNASDGKETGAANLKEGVASLRLVGASGVAKSLVRKATVSGSTGDFVSVSFFAKGVNVPANGACSVKVFLLNGTTILASKTVNCPTGSYAFKKLTVPLLTAASAYNGIQVKITYEKSSGTIFFDALQLLRSP